ncbi:LysR substrate-binding domain-containing protein [Maridesulfovibrio ferrireducens]|uniref:LysR substrate-binding domain-containing protein n=1 Tax=Maridesulfovibrio ferrireducens TaxID=246191 RepID=UPI001A196413|nr:LysR substrate-binding domain-containing protein [Maridesulfovibrio ferrireducens]MBI9112556.1 LysR family transcriptional regulator [Maridesulfovibrio ferrireducens]
MELRQLRYFIAVAEELHFGRAAQRVHIAQPPFSQQIKSLEEEIGAKLLERNSRKVRLTEEGRYFYEQAVSILEQTDLAVSTVSRMAKGESGSVKVGFMEIAMDSLLPEAIRAFRHKHSDVSVLISQLGASAQLERIRSDELDVGFSTVFMHGMEGLASIRLFSKKHVLAVPDDHAFTRKKSLSLKEIAKEKLIMFPRAGQPDLHDSIMQAFSKRGLVPIISQEVSGLSGAAALISSGMGVAFLLDNSHVSRTGITLIPVIEEFPSMDIFMVWNKDSCSNTAKVFMERVADYFSVSKIIFNGTS